MPNPTKQSVAADAKKIERIVASIEKAQELLMDVRLDGGPPLAESIACILDKQLDVAEEIAQALQQAHEGKDVDPVKGRVTSF